MQQMFPSESVGLVSPTSKKFAKKLSLDCGVTLNNFDLCFETYGNLNARKDNGVLICHALSGDHHAAGYHTAHDQKPGWWENYIGPGKPIDTNKFYVVCPNNLGGCGGSTGPLSVDPNSGFRYGPDFPMVTVRDWVESQCLLADSLGISEWAAVVGGSLGGMQALQWAIDYPNRIRNAIVIAAAPQISTQNIAFNEIARQAIRSDPDFYNGRYYEHEVMPDDGLKLARMIGHITYLSDDVLHSKFGRELKEGKIRFDYGVEFEIESYLKHQGESFVGRFDANTYLLMTKALDYFDPAKNYGGDLTAAVSKCECNFLVISFSSDWRFSPARSREIVRALLENNHNVSYVEVESAQGHDSFLLPIKHYHNVLAAYMKRIEVAE
jgi:homoserine O-acetyltransferase